MKSLIIVEVNTDLKQWKEHHFDKSMKSNEPYQIDYTKEVDECFHNAIHRLVENAIINDDGIEEDVFEFMGEDNNLPDKVKEIGDLGTVGMKLSHEFIKPKLSQKTEDLHGNK